LPLFYPILRILILQVVLQSNTTFYLYIYSVLITLSLDCNCVLQSARALILGKAKSYILTNLQLLRVVYAKDPFTMLVNVTKLNTWT
jgi:hypothetical protein